MKVLDPRQSILKFREEFRRRDSRCLLAEEPDVAARLELARARLLALSLLLEVEPLVLEDFLDQLVWKADLSDRSLVAARYEAGLPHPVHGPLNSGFEPSHETLSQILQAADEVERLGDTLRNSQ